MRNFKLSGIITCTAIALSALVCLPVDAQSNRRGSHRTEQSGSNRNFGQGRRPGNSSNRNNNRVNNNRNDNKKPNNGVGRPNGPQPGNDRYNGKPGHDHQNPSGGNHYGQHAPKPKPQPGHHYGQQRPGYPAPAPHPNRPKYKPMPRVAPPPHWRPHHNAPIINGILGLTFGSIFNVSLEYLYYNNYYIESCSDDVIYLRNVRQFRYNWDDVILNYVSGRFANAQFVYSSLFHNTDRYNNVYMTLNNTYGNPISMRILPGGGYECVWYGGRRCGTVTLEYYPNRGRYYTILCYGTT